MPSSRIFHPNNEYLSKTIRRSSAAHVYEWTLNLTASKNWNNFEKTQGKQLKPDQNGGSTCIYAKLAARGLVMSKRETADKKKCGWLSCPIYRRLGSKGLNTCKAIRTLIYFKLDESLWHSSLKFLLELTMQLRRYILISRVGEWMKGMSNLTDKCEAV